MYYKFQDSYIFDEEWKRCYEYNWKVIADRQDRWDWIVRSIMIDMFNWDINHVTIKYSETYLSSVEIVKKLWDVRQLVEVSDDEAIKTLVENKPTLTLLRHKLNIGAIQ